jgi:ABC-type glycerol-3-phosphate transport system substrate-binding protein
MKKFALCTILLLLLLGTAGCNKEEKMITADEVTTDTILAKANGVLQVATVEDFDKSYYDLGELQDFIAQKIDAYNKEAGSVKIKVDDVSLKSGKAIMILTYSGMDQYASFNDVTAAYFNGGITENTLDMPETLVSEKDGSLASTQEVLQNGKYKILVMTEPYHIIVDGKIKYYSENAVLSEDKTIKGAEDGMTIVVFKP